MTHGCANARHIACVSQSGSHKTSRKKKKVISFCLSPILCEVRKTQAKPEEVDIPV